MSAKDDLDEFGIGGEGRTEAPSSAFTGMTTVNVAPIDFQTVHPPVYFQPGKYVVKILHCLLHQRIHTGKDIFVVETEILKSDNAAMVPGMCPSWVVPIDNIGGPFAVKAFLAAALDVPVNSISELDLDPTTLIPRVAGLHMKVIAASKLTKRGGMYTHMTWEKP
jgi:hypothetical protein